MCVCVCVPFMLRNVCQYCIRYFMFEKFFGLFVKWFSTINLLSQKETHEKELKASEKRKENEGKKKEEIDGIKMAYNSMMSMQYFTTWNLIHGQHFLSIHLFDAIMCSCTNIVSLFLRHRLHKLLTCHHLNFVIATIFMSKTYWPLKRFHICMNW